MEPQHSLCSVLTSCFVHISCMLITKMARKKAYCSIDNPRYRKVLDQVASSSTPLPPFCPLGGGRVQFVWKGTWPFKNLGEALSLFSMFPHTDTLRDELIHFRLLTEHWILAAFVYLCAHVPTLPVAHTCTVWMEVSAVSHPPLHYWGRGTVPQCIPGCHVDICLCKGFSALSLELV